MPSYYQHNKQHRGGSSASSTTSSTMSFWPCHPASMDGSEYEDGSDDIIDDGQSGRLRAPPSSVSSVTPPPPRLRLIMDGLMAPFLTCVQPPDSHCGSMVYGPSPNWNARARKMTTPDSARDPPVTTVFGPCGAAPMHARDDSSATARPQRRYCYNSSHPSLLSPSLPRMNIVEPSKNDILCGRGGSSINHFGNQNFRALIAANKVQYGCLTKKQKMLMARQLVDCVHAAQGRFLARDAKTDLWYDIGLSRSLEKTSQALREKSASEKAEATKNATESGDSNEGGINSAPSEDTSVSSQKRGSKESIKAPPIVIPDCLRAIYSRHGQENHPHLYYNQSYDWQHVTHTPPPTFLSTTGPAPVTYPINRINSHQDSGIFALDSDHLPPRPPSSKSVSNCSRDASRSGILRRGSMNSLQASSPSSPGNLIMTRSGSFVATPQLISTTRSFSSEITPQTRGSRSLAGSNFSVFSSDSFDQANSNVCSEFNDDSHFSFQCRFDRKTSDNSTLSTILGSPERQQQPKRQRTHLPHDAVVPSSLAETDPPLRSHSSSSLLSSVMESRLSLEERVVGGRRRQGNSVRQTGEKSDSVDNLFIESGQELDSDGHKTPYITNDIQSLLLPVTPTSSSPPSPPLSSFSSSPPHFTLQPPSSVFQDHHARRRGRRPAPFFPKEATMTTGGSPASRGIHNNMGSVINHQQCDGGATMIDGLAALSTAAFLRLDETG